MRTLHPLALNAIGPLLAASLLLAVGCQDSGAGGFVDYAETEESETAVSEESDAAQPTAPTTSVPPTDEVTDAGSATDTRPATEDLDSTESASTDLAAPGEEPAVQPSESGSADQPSGSEGSSSSNGPAATAAAQPSKAADQPEPDVQPTAESDPSKPPTAVREVTQSDSADATSPDSTDTESESADPAPVEPAEIKLLVPKQTFRKEGDAGALRVSYDDIDLLKVLNMEPVPVDAVEYFPDWLKALDGQRIRIRGFMYPTFQASGITAFMLARDNGICCFQRQPKIYDVFGVELAEGETTDYIEGKPFDVEGIFHIDPEADDTELYQLYRIEDAHVLR